MSARFAVKRGHRLATLTFSRPAFELFDTPGGKFESAVFDQFRSHGVRVADISKAVDVASLDDVKLSISLHDGRLNVDIRIARIDVYTADVKKVSGEASGAAIASAFAAVSDLVADARIGVVSSILEMHGEVSAGTDAMTLRKVPPLEGLGTPVGAGYALYYAASKERLTGVVAVDRSVFEPDWVYVKIGGTWDMSKASLPTFGTLWNAYYDDVLKALELDLEWA